MLLPSSGHLAGLSSPLNEVASPPEVPKSSRLCFLPLLPTSFCPHSPTIPVFFVCLFVSSSGPLYLLSPLLDLGLLSISMANTFLAFECQFRQSDLVYTATSYPLTAQVLFLSLYFFQTNTNTLEFSCWFVCEAFSPDCNFPEGKAFVFLDGYCSTKPPDWCLSLNSLLEPQGQMWSQQDPPWLSLSLIPSINIPAGLSFLLVATTMMEPPAPFQLLAPKNCHCFQQHFRNELLLAPFQCHPLTQSWELLRSYSLLCPESLRAIVQGWMWGQQPPSPWVAPAEAAVGGCLLGFCSTDVNPSACERAVELWWRQSGPSVLSF